MIKYEDLKKVNNLTIKNRKKLFETFWNQGMYILGNQVKKFEKNLGNLKNSRILMNLKKIREILGY